MRRVGTILFAAALGLAVVTGCSGEEEPNAASDQGNSSDTTEANGDNGSGQDTDTESTDGGSDSAYCDEARSAGQEILSPGANSADFVQVYRDIAAAAPADIKPEWTSIADSLESLQESQEELANPDTSDPEAAMKDLEKATQEMEKVTREMETALQAVTDDIASRCGVTSG